MTPIDPTKPPLEDPLAEIEHQLINAYVAGAGHTLESLLKRDDQEARTLLAAASRYASARLSEVESRYQYLRRLQGGS